MLWLTLLLAVRGVESLDFCFNASLEGKDSKHVLR
jgi:hypothetical protein